MLDIVNIKKLERKQEIMLANILGHYIMNLNKYAGDYLNIVKIE